VSQPRPRPDPRIAQTRHLVLDAALKELAEAGYGGFAIEQVAARSGVAKSTIYRHWRSRLELISDAFETLHQDRRPDLSAGAARERLARIVRHVAETVATEPFSACLPALIDAAERDAELRAFHHRFQVEARRPLDAAVAEALTEQGGDAAAAPLIATALLGAVFYQRLMTGAPFDPACAGALVDSLLGPG